MARLTAYLPSGFVLFHNPLGFFTHSRTLPSDFRIIASMKLRSLTLSLLLLLLSTFAGAQDLWKEHILKTSRLDEWTVHKISRQLTGLPGIRFVGYCRQASCLLIKYDPSQIRSVKVIKGLILGAHSPMRLTEVKGYSFYEVIDGVLDSKKPKSRLTASRSVKP